jgi:hypothetical protein
LKLKGNSFPKNNIKVRLGCQLSLSLLNAALLFPVVIIKLTRKLEGGIGDGEDRGVEIGKRGFERIVLCFCITE